CNTPPPTVPCAPPLHDALPILRLASAGRADRGAGHRRGLVRCCRVRPSSRVEVPGRRLRRRLVRVGAELVRVCGKLLTGEGDPLRPARGADVTLCQPRSAALVNRRASPEIRKRERVVAVATVGGAEQLEELRVL